MEAQQNAEVYLYYVCTFYTYTSYSIECHRILQMEAYYDCMKINFLHKERHRNTTEPWKG